MEVKTRGEKKSFALQKCHMLFDQSVKFNIFQFIGKKIRYTV
jgi:hypothetical protein